MRTLWAEISDLAVSDQTHAEFILVYIEEAHAADEWPIYQLEKDIPQHKSLQERLVAAKQFQADFFTAQSPIRLFADDIDNNFNLAYASWPFRFWVIEKQVGGPPLVGLKAMPQNSSYDLQDCRDYLQLRVTTDSK